MENEHSFARKAAVQIGLTAEFQAPQEKLEVKKKELKINHRKSVMEASVSRKLPRTPPL